MRKLLPSVEALNRLFVYDGVELYWRHSGKVAGGKPAKRGYTQITRGKWYKHRIIWKMVHGTEPYMLDHKDRNPRNNRIENLRECTDSLNQGNVERNGCYFYDTPARKRKWRARVRANGKELTAWFATEEEARNAIKEMAYAEFGPFAHAD